MTASRAVVANSVLGEEYMRLIMQTLAQHRRSEYVISGMVPLRGRLTSLPSGAGMRQVRTYATLVRLVSIAEAYTSLRLATHLEMHAPPPRSPLVDELYIREENLATGGWDRMSLSYKKWVGGVELSKCDGYATVTNLIEVRNAIAHGLGQFTRRQSRDRGLSRRIGELKKLGITMDGRDKLNISDSALKTAAIACRAFVSALDAELQQAASP